MFIPNYEKNLYMFNVQALESGFEKNLLSTSSYKSVFAKFEKRLYSFRHIKKHMPSAS